MDATLELTHERVNDLPLLLRFLIKLQLPEILERHFPAHPLHQGLNGWLITVWIAYILSHADHRKSPVQVWTEELQRTLETLTGQTLRPVDFNDDRLTLLLKRLAATDAGEALEADLWHTHRDQTLGTNMAVSRLSLVDSVLDYRAGTCVERAFHLLKDQPLGIRPMLVHRDNQVRGLTPLLT